MDGLCNMVESFDPSLATESREHTTMKLSQIQNFSCTVHRCKISYAIYCVLFRKLFDLKWARDFIKYQSYDDESRLAPLHTAKASVGLDRS